MKAVIPAAGFGTRMLPAAKAVPKEMLPVLGKPTIQYVLEEAADAGATDVLLVVSRDKKAIEDHFDRSPELESRLAATGRSDLIASVRQLTARLRIHTTRQPDMRGLGDAVSLARDHVGRQAFLCLLGDTIFSGDGPLSPARQLHDAQQALGGRCSVIGLERVPRERVSRYGIVAADPPRNDICRIRGLVEKPRPENAPSDLAVAARYLLMPEVFDHLATAVPGTGGEIQLTDALDQLARHGEVYGVILQQRRHDIGSPEGWLATNLRFARREPELWSHLRPLLDELRADA